MLPHVSANALSEVRSAIQKDGIPEGGQNRGLMRAARDEICTQVGPCGAILQHCTLVGKEKKPTVNIAFANPFAMLHAAVGASPNLQKLFCQQVA